MQAMRIPQNHRQMSQLNGLHSSALGIERCCLFGGVEQGSVVMTGRSLQNQPGHLKSKTHSEFVSVGFLWISLHCAANQNRRINFVEEVAGCGC